MDIFFCDTSEYRQAARRYRSVLAAGPVLIDGGRIVEYDSDKTFYTGRHPRTLIGKRADGEVVMAVIDGRFRGEGEGATIAETAYIARLLGLGRGPEPRRRRLLDALDRPERRAQPSLRQPPLRPCRRTGRAQLHRSAQ